MSNNGLPTDYQTFIDTSRYAQRLDDEGREARVTLKGSDDDR